MLPKRWVVLISVIFVFLIIGFAIASIGYNNVEATQKDVYQRDYLNSALLNIGTGFISAAIITIVFAIYGLDYNDTNINKELLTTQTKEEANSKMRESVRKRTIEMIVHLISAKKIGFRDIDIFIDSGFITAKDKSEIREKI